MPLLIAIALLVCFSFNSFADEDLEAAIKEAESVLNRIDNAAFLYVLRKDEGDANDAAYKKLALQARGPIQCGARSDNTPRVYEEIMWLEPADEIEEPPVKGFGGGASDARRLTHDITFYDGQTAWMWASATNGVNTTQSPNYMQLSRPPHLLGVLETHFFSPLVCVFDALAQRGALGQSGLSINAMTTQVQIHFQQGQEPNNMESHYYLDREKGFLRSAVKAGSMNFQNIIDEHQQVNGVWVPKSGRLINRRNERVVELTVLEARVNDSSVIEALKPFDHANPKWNEKRRNPSLPMREHPTYMDDFFDLGIEEAYQLFLTH